MKRTQLTSYDLSIMCRSESGRCSFDVGLDNLAPHERKFLFNAIAAVKQGGSVEFSLTQTGVGEKQLTLTMRDKGAVAIGVSQAIETAHVNGSSENGNSPL